MQRFRQSIETQRLKNLDDITAADLKMVEDGMDKSSKWEGGTTTRSRSTSRCPIPPRSRRTLTRWRCGSPRSASDARDDAPASPSSIAGAPPALLLFTHEDRPLDCAHRDPIGLPTRPGRSPLLGPTTGPFQPLFDVSKRSQRAPAELSTYRHCSANRRNGSVHIRVRIPLGSHSFSLG